MPQAIGKFEWTPEALAKTLRDDLGDAHMMFSAFIHRPDPWALTEAEVKVRKVLDGIDLIRKEMAKHNG